MLALIVSPSRLFWLEMVAPRGPTVLPVLCAFLLGRVAWRASNQRAPSLTSAEIEALLDAASARGAAWREAAGEGPAAEGPECPPEPECPAFGARELGLHVVLVLLREVAALVRARCCPRVGAERDNQPRVIGTPVAPAAGQHGGHPRRRDAGRVDGPSAR